MELPIFQVDAFTDRVFRGNPAAVVLLPQAVKDSLLQAVAAENNLSETAFILETSDGFDLRWFTPVSEVDLCGHATLAAAHVLFSRGRVRGERVHFLTRSGRLSVERTGERYTLDFPSRPPRPADVTAELVEALGAQPSEAHEARDLMAVFQTEAEVAELRPDFEKIRRSGVFAIIATAAGDSVDFVSRFFAPGVGVPEDPVTGSAHCTLTPYWAKRLGKSTLRARQISSRGGELICQDAGERVRITGAAVDYLSGVIFC